MNSETVVYCVVALLLGMLLAHMLKDVCGCNKVLEGSGPIGDCVGYGFGGVVEYRHPTVNDFCGGRDKFVPY